MKIKDKNFSPPRPRVKSFIQNCKESKLKVISILKSSNKVLGSCKDTSPEFNQKDVLNNAGENYFFKNE